MDFQPRTLEVWENLGLLRDTLDAAIPLRGQLVYVNGEQVARIDLALPPDVPYGFVALPQYVTERLLTQQLHQFGGRVERGVELVAFESDSDGVNARLRTAGGGEQEVRVRYLVGADGTHSRARKGLGLDFAVDAFPEQYMLGDVEVDWPLPTGYVARSSHQTDGRTDDMLVCVPLPGTGRYRMSMLVPDDLATRPAQGEVQHAWKLARLPNCTTSKPSSMACRPNLSGHTCCAGRRCSESATGWLIGRARGVLSLPAMPLTSTRRPVLKA